VESPIGGGGFGALRTEEVDESQRGDHDLLDIRNTLIDVRPASDIFKHQSQKTKKSTTLCNRYWTCIGNNSGDILLQSRLWELNSNTCGEWLPRLLHPRRLPQLETFAGGSPS
jgi:hypothetical protein